jgi:hypothetical protein
MNKSDQNHLIAEQWIAAFNAHDCNAILALYKQDAEHFSPRLKNLQPSTEGVLKGHAQLKAWWQDSFDRLPSLQYQLYKTFPDSEKVVMGYHRMVDGEEDIFVTEVLEIKNGLIHKSYIVPIEMK